MQITLKIESGPLANTCFPIEPGEALSVGRTMLANCVVPQDTTLSRVHFEVRCDAQTCRIRDLKSSNGTYLNGTATTESTLHDGDEIIAGQTRFSFHVELKPLLPAPPPAPIDPHLVQERLLAALRNNSQPQYAVVDAARDPAILRALMHSGADYCSLFQGEAVSPLALFVPYVVRILPQSPFLPLLLKAGWGHSWGLCLSSKAAPWEVVAFLTKLLTVRLPDGQAALLRFFDPRILRTLLPSCTSIQLRQIFGPIRYFMMEGEEPDRALGFSFKSRGLEKYKLPLTAAVPLRPTMIEVTPVDPPYWFQNPGDDPSGMLTLRPDQVALLEQAKKHSQQKTLLAELREMYPEECAVLGEERLRDFVEYGSTRAQRYGIRAHADVRSYIHLMMRLGKNFDTDPGMPWAGDLLGRRKKPSEKIAMTQAAAARHVQSVSC